MKRVFNGVDLNVSGRFGNDATLGGGVAFGNTLIDNCGIAVDSPQDLRFCRTSYGWSDDVQVKINGTYPLPLACGPATSFRACRASRFWPTTS